MIVWRGEVYIDNQRQEATLQIAGRLHHPFGVILLGRASTVMLGFESPQDNMEKFGSLTQIIG